jgi:hypothetical protein
MTNAQLHGCAFDGWQCFHCGEIFTTVGGARNHFGATPDAKPGCMVRVQIGDERGLQMELRKVEQQRDELQKAVNALSHQIALANGTVLLARQQRDAALAGLSRIAKYPLTRADELSAEQMRDLALNYHAKGLGCCQYCGGSGDVHGLDGEWRGECTECDAIAKAQGVV